MTKAEKELITPEEEVKETPEEENPEAKPEGSEVQPEAEPEEGEVKPETDENAQKRINDLMSKWQKSEAELSKYREKENINKEEPQKFGDDFVPENYDTLYEKFKEQNFIVLGISLEDKQTLISFRDENKITYPILLGNNEVAKAYDVKAIPSSVFIDKTGRIRKTQVGFSPEQAPMFEAFIDTLLKE